VKVTVYASFRPSTATSRWLPVKWRHFHVTSGHLRSCDVVSCAVTTSPCELQPCRKWNSQDTWVFSLLQPLSSNFRSNDVTFGSLPVSWVHVMSFPVTWLPPPLSYHLVKSESQYTQVFGPLQPLPGDFRSNNDTSGWLPVTWGHVTFPVPSLPPHASYSLVGSETHSTREFLAFYSHFQVTSGEMTSLLGHFRSPEVTWHHFLSRDCLPIKATAL